MELVRPDFETYDAGDFSQLSKWDVFELKYDGFSCTFVMDNGTWTLYSRTGRVLDSASAESYKDIKRTVLYGEYIFGTEWAKDNESLYGKIALFDASMINGEDLLHVSNSEVRNKIFLFTVALFKTELSGKLFLVSQFPIEKAKEVWDLEVMHRGYEGLVFKNSKTSWGYGFGRMKKSITMDYVLMDVKESDSDSFAGIGKSIIGGLYVDGVLTKCCSVGGLDISQREEFFKNRSSYIGLVFEAEGKKVSKKGSLRHPNFKRIRYDKKPEDCTWPQKCG